MVALHAEIDVAEVLEAEVEALKVESQGQSVRQHTLVSPATAATVPAAPVVPPQVFFGQLQALLQSDASLCVGLHNWMANGLQGEFPALQALQVVTASAGSASGAPSATRLLQLPWIATSLGASVRWRLAELSLLLRSRRRG